MRTHLLLSTLAALVAGAHVPASGQTPDADAADLSLAVAKFSANGELMFPTDAERWITIGAGLGGDYGEEAFDPANPGTISVVQMEPSSYDYFVKNGRYADGTMLLLTFYAVQQKPEPQLRGFVQRDAVQREIHMIDRARFPEESRAFFLYPPGAQAAAPLAAGSECVQCHSEHGAFDATFTQFYPVVRDVPSEAGR